MSWLSKLTGVNIKIGTIVPGADALAIRKVLDSLKLDADTLRTLSNVADMMAVEKDKK